MTSISSINIENVREWCCHCLCNIKDKPNLMAYDNEEDNYKCIPGTECPYRTCLDCDVLREYSDYKRCDYCNEISHNDDFDDDFIKCMECNLKEQPNRYMKCACGEIYDFIWFRSKCPNCGHSSDCHYNCTTCSCLKW